ncbi:MAG: DNA polymerase Y family protein [Devosia sp.]
MASSGLMPVPGQMGFKLQRRYLALHLPRWETDCLRRADPELATLTRPFALWEKKRGAMRIVAADARASRQGIFVSQSLSDAKAIVPDLEAREIDRGFLASAFADFANWHSNASPIVSVLTDQAQWGDLVLDIEGVSHLFGSEAIMLETLMDRLAELGFTVNGAIASTVGAAWALANHGAAQIVGEDARQALANLPVAALRLHEEQIAGLRHLGLKSIGQLYGRDRRSLQARFGTSLLLRLDQALGFVEERVTPRLPLVDHYAERRFAEPIALMDDVLMTARDLGFQLAARLEREGVGAQAFHLFLYRVDHKVMTLSVNAGRATRDAAHIGRLFAHRVDRLQGEYDAGFGIDMIRLAASSLSPLAQHQIGAFESADGAADLDRLYDRMASRLGPLAVVHSKFVNTHIPEQAVELEPIIARTEDDPQATPDRSLRRPLRLLPAPEPVTVAFAEVPDGPPPNMIWRRVRYRFVKTSGPERIGVEWWSLPEAMLGPSGGDKAVNDGSGLTRDYYIAEDESGRRFWLFREGWYGEGAFPRWFLQGFFG